MLSRLIAQVAHRNNNNPNTVRLPGLIKRLQNAFPLTPPYPRLGIAGDGITALEGQHPGH